MTPIHIRALRHSAFYSPLLLTVAAGFLREEGLSPHYDVATPEKSVTQGIASGEIHVAQSAVATSFAALDRGDTPQVLHFAQINARDGFFLTARTDNSAFSWSDLVTGPVLIDHFFQPLAMFKYALHRLDITWSDLNVIDAGDVESMDAAYRSGMGMFVHQQGPYAQQLEFDGVGKVVAAVGDIIGEVAFSSLCADPHWLNTAMAQAFMRAYRNGLKFAIEQPAAHVAKLLKPFFTSIDARVLQNTVATYQRLGCWQLDPTIGEAAYETTLDVFAHSGLIQRRYDYNKVVAAPPDQI